MVNCSLPKLGRVRVGLVVTLLVPENELLYGTAAYTLVLPDDVAAEKAIDPLYSCKQALADRALPT